MADPARTVELTVDQLRSLLEEAVETGVERALERAGCSYEVAKDVVAGRSWREQSEAA